MSQTLVNQGIERLLTVKTAENLAWQDFQQF